ncbi:hypothetical protein CGH80_01025 [Vibrio parahaemolyticus]|nr:hypothetical protein CGJ41_10835 [Vibrio parahaemolyticus]TOF46636.1 hypothetical protein CGJ28_11150 [Vibrio parahaemolyticus]TOH34708.1 hypothetical protein CGI84_09460 [Vibrio parahaemolyticus]TOM16483.1 hypothetical protein CGH83_01305 [Vibrio parahaemolyticus]TOM41897.1 hypothetical protein CGH77_10800 [Vibrio parahaemolyticus]
MKNEHAQFHIKTKGIAHVRIKQTRPRIDFLANHILLFLYFKTNIDGDSHTRRARTFGVNRWGRSQSRTQSHAA